jgi:hypothetical protein
MKAFMWRFNEVCTYILSAVSKTRLPSVIDNLLLKQQEVWEKDMTVALRQNICHCKNSTIVLINLFQINTVKKFWKSVCNACKIKKNSKMSQVLNVLLFIEFQWCDKKTNKIIYKFIWVWYWYKVYKNVILNKKK